MNILVIINDPPYGTEKAYNALRLSNQFLKKYPEASVNIFLLADGVFCGIADQKTPEGYFSIERMLTIFKAKGGKVKACGTCLDARGMATLKMAAAVERGTMSDLAQWTFEADKVLTF